MQHTSPCEWDILPTERLYIRGRSALMDYSESGNLQCCGIKGKKKKKTFKNSPGIWTHNESWWGPNELFLAWTPVSIVSVWFFCWFLMLTLQERLAFLVGLLRKAMVLIACVVLLYFAIRFRNVNRESLEILRELKETHRNLQQTLRKAGKGLASAGMRNLWVCPWVWLLLLLCFVFFFFPRTSFRIFE